MKIVVLGGYGEIGSCISADLAATAKGFEVVVAGRDKQKAEQLVRSLGARNLKVAEADSKDAAQLGSVFEDADVVVNATNYYSNVDIMKAALRSGINYIDLGGLYHTTLKQLKLHQQFKKKGLLAVLGCGSTPGLTSMLARYGADMLDSISAIHFQFGDKDYTKYNMSFVVPYSMQTVFDEFSKRPAVFQNGRMRFVEPLSGSTEVNFPKPVGRITCRYSLHSELATIPYTFKDKGIRDCSFRGGWDDDFIMKTKFLIDAGFSSDVPIDVAGTNVSPRKVAVSLLNKFLPPKTARIDDLEFLRIELTGRKKGKARRLVVYCRSVTEKRRNIPAGTWDTGVPPSIVAQMIARKGINSVGALPPERVKMDYNALFGELGKRNIDVFRRFE